IERSDDTANMRDFFLWMVGSAHRLELHATKRISLVHMMKGGLVFTGTLFARRQREMEMAPLRRGQIWTVGQLCYSFRFLPRHPSFEEIQDSSNGVAVPRFKLSRLEVALVPFLKASESAVEIAQSDIWPRCERLGCNDSLIMTDYLFKPVRVGERLAERDSNRGPVRVLR